MSVSKPGRDAVVLDYHRQSKHHLSHYADGPGTLDWDAQPNPFRHFEGAQRVNLALGADGLSTTYQQLSTPDTIVVRPLTLENIGLFFELSFAISAWKQFGTARWSLRCNPSSGNLHPTEVYLLAQQNIAGLAAGVYHYCSDEHALEQRCRFASDDIATQAIGQFHLALSSIAWREAWKYGVRAFRYCQLDVGHALAAMRYAAACLGWRVTLDVAITDREISQLLGIERKQDFIHAERETPELLCTISAQNIEAMPINVEALKTSVSSGEWSGLANRIDPKPMYQWPVIDVITQATEKTASDCIVSDIKKPTPLSPHPGTELQLSLLLQRRRSAQAYDGQTAMSRTDFLHLLEALAPSRDHAPLDTWPTAVQINLVFFIHRVEGLSPGLYALVRTEIDKADIQTKFNEKFTWDRVSGCPEAIPFYHLVSANAQTAAKRLACQQDIAGQSAFSVAMLANFPENLNMQPWLYRRLYWEAGMLGQVMYIEAEASGLRGTGIGCFFDDALHELLGLQNERTQCLYQFTVGSPVQDGRILQLPPYEHLSDRTPQS